MAPTGHHLDGRGRIVRHHGGEFGGSAQALDDGKRTCAATVSGSRAMRAVRWSRSTSSASTSARTNSRSERRPNPPVTATVRQSHLRQSDAVRVHVGPLVVGRAHAEVASISRGVSPDRSLNTARSASSDAVGSAGRSASGRAPWTAWLPNTRIWVPGEGPMRCSSPALCLRFTRVLNLHLRGAAVLRPSRLIDRVADRAARCRASIERHLARQAPNRST